MYQHKMYIRIENKIQEYTYEKIKHYGTGTKRLGTESGLIIKRTI